jgi:hypothetical protein
MTPMELRRQGLAALRKELGYVGRCAFFTNLMRGVATIRKSVTSGKMG